MAPGVAVEAQPALLLDPDWPRLLTAACAGTGVHAVYQPIVDLRHGGVVGYEGLTRFAGHQVGPEAWFDAARRHGRAVELEAAALARVLAARDDLPPRTFLSVNVCPQSLASGPVAEALDNERDLKGLVIELTEQTPVENYAHLSGCLDRYRSRGALVALDDAGSGYAGLCHILELRPSIVKLDRTLVSGVDRDEAKRVLIEMLVLFAGHIDACLVAEGIETLTELEALRQLGVPYGQGWVLGRPAGPWARVEGDAAALIASPAAGGTDQACAVTQLLEQVRTVDVGEPPLLADAGYVVVVDQLGAPVGVWSPDATGAEPMAPVLTVAPTVAVADLARRAIVRPSAQRFDPVVCTGVSGRVLGIIRIERVLDLLARNLRDLGGFLPRGDHRPVPILRE